MSPAAENCRNLIPRSFNVCSSENLYAMMNSSRTGFFYLKFLSLVDRTTDYVEIWFSELLV